MKERKPAFVTSEDIALPIGLKVSWGVGSFGGALLSNAVGALVLYYLTKVTGMPAWLAGVLLTVARLYDAFFDPYIGQLSDRTHRPKGGRRRPYLLAGACLSAIAIVGVFNVPFRGDQWLGVIYALLALLFFGTAYSVFNVPYLAMPAEMTGGYHERSSIMGWRVIFSGLGIAMASSGAGVALALFSKSRHQIGAQVNTQSDYSILSAVFAVLIFISMIVSWRGTRSASVTERTESLPPWREQLQTFLGNKPFLTILGVKCFQLVAISSNQAATFFMLVDVLKRSSAEVAFFGIPSIVASIFATPILVHFSKRFGKKAGYVVSALFTATSYLSWCLAVPSEPRWGLVIRGAILGVGFSGGTLFGMSMVTDAIEFDANRTGMRREGIYAASFSFCEKFFGAVGPTLVGVALSLAGLNAKANVTAANYSHVRQATLLGVAYFPAACYLLAVLLLMRYRLTPIELERSRLTAVAKSISLEPSRTRE